MRIRSLLVSLLAVTPLAACGAPATPSPGPVAVGVGSCPAAPGPVALAVGGHRNGGVPVLTGRARGLVIDHVLPGGPTLALVSVEGVPRVVVAPQAFVSDAGNSAAVDEDRARFLADVDAAVAGLRAQSPQVDVLGALALAARTARGGDGTPGTVVLVDPGLQTVPPLDQREPGVLDADVDELVAHLRRTGTLPDLRGLTVVFARVGDTAAPQPALDTGRRAHLVETWRSVAAAAGAACVEVDPTPAATEPVADGPDVGVVAVPPLPNLAGDRLVLPDDATVGFRPGSAEFRDPTAARTALAPVADRLRAEPTRRVMLTGTTARWGDPSAQRDLGLRRAGAVRAVLVGAGIDPGRIDAVGVGSGFPGYVDDLADDGTLLPGPAARNRTVVVELR